MHRVLVFISDLQKRMVIVFSLLTHCTQIQINTYQTLENRPLYRKTKTSVTLNLIVYARIIQIVAIALVPYLRLPLYKFLHIIFLRIINMIVSIQFFLSIIHTVFSLLYFLECNFVSALLC